MIFKNAPGGIKRGILILVIVFSLVLSVVFMISPVQAQEDEDPVTVEIDTEYTGSVESDSERIRVTVEFSPDDNEMVDILLNTAGTENSFADYETRERSISSPGQTEPDISYEGSGTWSVDFMQPDDEISVQFDVYPRSINVEELDVADIDLIYTMQGQELSISETATADLSGSAYFQWQEGGDDDDDNDGWDLLSMVVGFIAAVFLFVVSYAVWWYALV